MSQEPFPEHLMQSTFDYVKALSDEPVIAVAVLTGSQDDDWLAVALAKPAEQSDKEVLALFMHALVATRKQDEG